MNTPHRYQYGSLTRRKRIRTEDVWQFRYYETNPEGRRRRRSKIIGALSEFPTQEDALRILQRFRLRLNLQNRLGLPMTLDALADDYVEKELPLLRYGTQQAHLSSLIAGYDRVGVGALFTKSSRLRLSSGFDLCRWRRSQR